ncbi:MAG: hypothetical protein Pars2KO_32300 [Parasphingorhabdus sp.]
MPEEAKAGGDATGNAQRVLLAKGVCNTNYTLHLIITDNLQNSGLIEKGAVVVSRRLKQAPTSRHQALMLIYNATYRLGNEPTYHHRLRG